MSKKYNIGIIGHTMADDYGLTMSYLGLCEFIKSSKKTYIVIPPPATKNWCKSSSVLFTKHYMCSKKLAIKNYNLYNNLIDTYILGPGPLWDYQSHSNKDADYCSYLNFVNNTCKIKTYGTSFKLDYPTVLISRPDKHLEYKKRLQRFNDITVASIDDTKILNTYYDISNSEPVIDSMFLPNAQFFLNFIKNKQLYTNNTLTIYPINKISRNETADFVARALNCKIDKIAINNSYDLQQIKERSITLDNVDILNPVESPLKFEDWLEKMYNSKYIMCCDYYSLCVCILFKKDFVVFEDPDDTRINFLCNKLGLSNRIIKNHEHDKAIELFNQCIDWDMIYSEVNKFKESSIEKINKMLSNE